MTSASTTPETTASARKGLSRRGMLAGSAAAAGAFSLGFAIPFGEAQAQGAVPEINAWVVIHPDDKVVIRIARSEMGQGTLTGLAQLVAEELNCDWSKVTTEYPTPGQNVARNRIWGNFSTGGSRGIRESHEYVRKGGASARTMLIQAAASEWNVPAAECTAEKSVITHKASGRSLRYGQVAAAAAKIEAPKDVALKDPKDWIIAGKPLARLDTADKTTGAKIYGMDFKLPGMLNAAIKDCPVFGGKVKSFDAAKIKAMPGVKHVLPVGDSAVTVVADTWWQAKTALDALPIVWDEGPHAKVSSASLAEWLKEGLDAPGAVIGNQNGDVKAAIAGAARTIEAVYSYPFQNHACMETMNATALYTPEKCEVWTPTQNGEAALAATAEASGLPIAKCEAYKIDLGGGFGRRGAVHDWVRQVVAIAKQIPGTPVKLIWSREEDMLHGRFHPLTQCKMTGALDKDGNLTGLHMRISGQSIVAGIFPQNIQNGRDPVVFQGLNASGPEASIGYSIPNLLIDHAMRNPHVPPGFWRGVNLNQNAIYLESFIDELANAAGKDPLEFRRALMKNHPKHLAVLNAAAEKAGWGKPLPAGVFRGICQTMGFGAYVAAVAEVSVSPEGKLKIHRIVAATDPGHVVNPAQVERQIEGSFVYGLSAALYGEITIKDGRVEQENFDTYEVMRLEAMPAVETVLVPSGGFWGGVGEPTIAVAAPAVLNAIFAATGKRIRNLPLKNADLKKA
ncbi:xanthine dehydrogenase family protein molybdopterin-binding subunit [Bosea sp. (in: a-proteobacteria)]|uniref:xanthine dehydrogenase family protein molybdopterin-binding subunit n=1 Tax=Bosea sp. (in: a-proteobacteria) TaxID=1871050 RepID=UPI002732B3CF|nr:molybdopterin cofactor-binding domain-containing protein [Bosea sp. (in: a-proteobacteria)]MDP3411425.1 molybdopterin-dependent oxidoreductase [Bosea sp. (in: a-proteobacteria)]